MAVGYRYCAVVARMIPSLKRVLKGLRYEAMNPHWEIAEFECLTGQSFYPETRRTELSFVS